VRFWHRVDAPAGCAAQPNGAIKYPGERCGAELSFTTCVIVFLVVYRGQRYRGRTTILDVWDL
jgi:hypothetical protein